jgi:hypothetical protein
MHASAISGAADHAIHEATPWLEKLARLGFVAKGVLYMTIGALAIGAALRLGGTPHGQRGAMGTLLRAPAGRVLLVIIAIGLFGYAIWRFIEAIRDPFHRHVDPKSQAKNVARRVRSAGLGVIQVALAFSALKIALGHTSAASDGNASSHWTARALATPGGTVALWLIAAAFVGYGLQQIYVGWKAKLDKELWLGQLSNDTRKFLVGASRFGIAARGVVFATTGVLVGRAIQHRDPQRVKGIKASLIELFELGRWPFAIVALGLVAYGVYQLLEARYRRIAIA